MSCDRCGSQTTRPNYCSQCALLAVAGDQPTDPGVDTADCGQCGEPAPEGSYAEQTPGMWLCSECHPQGNSGRQPMEAGR